MTASGHRDLPGELENVYADDVTGSGQKTATGHAESEPGETGIDPRIETGLPENESAHIESGSSQKTATDRDDDRLRRSQPLDREREEEREQRPRS